MAFVPEGRCDRSLARSAWDAAPKEGRPVGYGVIPAGVRTDSMIGVTKFRIRKPKNIGLDSSNLSRPPKLCLATGLWRIQRRYLAGTVHYIEQQLEHHRTRTFQEEYLAFLKKHGAHFDEKYLWD